MQSDPLIEAFRKIVLRVLNDTNQIDFRAFYPGRVTSQAGPGGLVDLFLDDERLKSKVGVPLAAIPGMTLALAPGTRVLLGWLGGDEQFPRVFPAWDGNGGLTTVKLQSTTSAAIVAPAVNLGDDPGAAPVMLGTAVSAQAALFAAMGSCFAAMATAFTAIGVAVPATAVPCAAAATACTAATAAVTSYAGQASNFIAVKVRAT